MSHHSNSANQVSRSKLNQGFFGRMLRCVPPYDPPGKTDQQKIDSLDLPYTVVNSGVSGETTSGGCGRIDWFVGGYD